MRYFLSRREPPRTRILLIESGSRSLLESVIPRLRAGFGEDVPLALVTCYGGVPAGLPPDAVVFRVTDYSSNESRKELIRKLQAQNYSIGAMICSAEPIMMKWKWLIAARIPAKFL